MHTQHSRTTTLAPPPPQVRATSLYVPERSSGQQLFTYSIRFSLLPPDDQVAHWPATAGLPRALESCQLLARHWVIRDEHGAVKDEVRGEGGWRGAGGRVHGAAVALHRALLSHRGIDS